MKDTQLNHFETYELHLTLEEMLAYIDQSLDSSDKARIEKVLQQSPIYAEALTSLKETLSQEPLSRERLDQVEAAFSQSVKLEAVKLKKTSSYVNDTHEPVIKMRRIWFSVAAAVVILLTISIGIFRYNQAPLEVRLAEAYMTHYVDPLGVMSEVEDQAFAFYNQQNYAQAIPLFEQLIQQSDLSKHQKLKMFLGVCLMQDNQEVAAERKFREIIDHGQSIYVPAAKWYLALSLFKQEKAQEGKQLLQDITSSTQADRQTRFYVDKAQELLLQINS